MERSVLKPDGESDSILAGHVHPSGWKNPEPAQMYNLVVIGGGTAGLVTAAGAAGLGAKVALVERGNLGGDCLNTGCVPSKALLRAARAAYDVRDSGRFGTRCLCAETDFPEIMERMRRLRAELAVHDSAERFKSLGVDVFFGDARFVSPREVAVAEHRLRFHRAAICTGGRPAVPPIPGLVDAGFLTSDTFFSTKELPPRLAVIGGGPIGCELAQACTRFGSRVTVIEAGSRLLGREDTDAAEIIRRIFISEGTTAHLEASVKAVSREGLAKTISFSLKGEAHQVEVDEILVAAGRLPNVDGLDLEAAGVSYDPARGVTVDERLRTTNSRVYAAGDVCSRYKFTHTADAQARILIENSLFFGRKKASALVIPWCTYTDPEVAHVGMYEQDAREKGIAVTTVTIPLADVDRAVLEGEEAGFFRVHLKKGSDKILGATIVARHAGEMIGEPALAITAGLGLSAIGGTIHPYPTIAEAARKAADAWNKTRLTATVRRILDVWLRWQRR